MNLFLNYIINFYLFKLIKYLILYLIKELQYLIQKFYYILFIDKQEIKGKEIEKHITLNN